MVSLVQGYFLLKKEHRTRGNSSLFILDPENNPATEEILSSVQKSRTCGSSNNTESVLYDLGLGLLEKKTKTVSIIFRLFILNKLLLKQYSAEHVFPFYMALEKTSMGIMFSFTVTAF